MEIEEKLELIDKKITTSIILSIPKLTPKLTHLNLAHNRINLLPDSLFLECPNLNHLNLYGNCIQEMPKSIRTLIDLKRSFILSGWPLIALEMVYILSI